ncbi:MAG: VOC family protein [Niastella sp.]|uniref:VOC family protein n=1 Tax=Niastella sp. TaxID=1869183 RepID=UPI00389A2C91
MPALNPYLNFNNNTEEAFNFYKSVFGGEFAMVMRFKDIPAEYKGPAHEDNKIMHISLPIPGGGMLMGSDVPEQMGKVVTGNNIQLSLTPSSKEEADKLFNGLSAGGQVTMPMADAFWGAYFGMCEDKFGIRWMINFDANQR